ncbi:MAG: ABC transporter substrate-binding protein [Candidatus Thiodiazotropha sp. (ex Semelilucina semeliformis)]|nr:ABC transporter substrate-binding protein [Candidatus Thiodiazotropha sp. (ex Semelilucina semeliformis)]
MRADTLHRHELIAVALCCTAFLTGLPAYAAQSDLVGQSIYHQGKGTEAATAYLSGAGIDVKSTRFACVQCHREDGSGNREGGVSAPDIRFQHLAQPYAGVRATGRRHSAYDENSLARAIQQGIDPAGNLLHAAMPRYRFSMQDMQALIDYLKRLDAFTAPGVSDDLIRIGTLQPSTGPLLQASLDVRRLLQGFIQQINSRGGIYGRRLELVVSEFDPDLNTSQISAVEALLRGQGVFCTLANLGLSPKGEAVQSLMAQGVPELAPLRQALEDDRNRDSHIFYLYASLPDQGVMLVDHLLSVNANEVPSVALVYVDDDHSRQGVHGIQKRMTEHGIDPTGVFSYQANDYDVVNLVRKLRSTATDDILFLGSGSQLQQLLDRADQIGWFPQVYGLAGLSGAVSTTISPKQSNRLTMLTPFSLPDAVSGNLTRFSNLLEQTSVVGPHWRIHQSAYSAARLLQAGLERLGRRPTRNGLVAGLNQLWKFETGVMPPLTFNENRRTGLRGGTIVAIDPESRNFYRIREWQEL